MNHEPNTQHWRIGDIVIHDADAKEPQMLMRVMGYTRDGLCKTQYCDKRRKRTIWKNDLKFLLDPRDFRLDWRWGELPQKYLEEIHRHWVNMRIWNQRFVGSKVRTTSGDGGFETIAHNAQMMGDHCSVWLERGGWWNRDFVEVICEQRSEELNV